MYKRQYQSETKGHSVLINDLANALYIKSVVNANPEKRLGILRRAKQQLLRATRFENPDPVVFVTLAEIECVTISLEPPKDANEKFKEIIALIEVATTRGYEFSYISLENLLGSRVSGHPFLELQKLDGDWKNKLRHATELP